MQLGNYCGFPKKGGNEYLFFVNVQKIVAQGQKENAERLVLSNYASP